MRQPIPFGKYYLLDRINVGGMAEVFKAKATGVEGFERMVAVKRILPSIAEDEEFITMFIDEAKIAVQLTHANIAQIFDLGRVDESYFIALEYVNGKDLRAIFNRGRARGEQMPIAMACFIIMKLCEGLDYAHNKRDAGGQFLNLVHRDISPQNILVSHEGEVKVIDFGIAKATGKAGRTQAGILKGKFGYMSPEQVQGLEIDRRSDVFGVGIVLYELLTGERLFVGETDFATLEKVRNVDIKPPSLHNKKIPEELEQIVLKALARDRAVRHQTAMQLHDELQGFMYSSGNYFGRRDLSMFMHRAFSEEIARETARDQEYAALSGEVRDDVTGLTAFDEIEPVSAVSALQPAPDGDTPVVSDSASTHAAPYKRSNKATLLGVPTASITASISQAQRPLNGPSGRSAPLVPPLVPRVESIPPNARPRAASAPPRLEMEWDDEEMSTQIYDRPDERSGAGVYAPPRPSAPGGYAPGMAYEAAPAAAPNAARAPVRAPSNPMTAFNGGPGAPSPFVASHPASIEPEAWPSARSQRKPMVLAGISVLVVIVVIVGALFVFRGSAPGAVHLSTIPTDVSVTVDGIPQVGSSPFVFSNVAPGVAHEIVISKDGYRPWVSRFQLQSDETMQLPPVTLTSLESGFVLGSVPAGASVFVDGKRISGVTPVRITDLTPGQHQIRLEVEGYAPWESSLHVTPGTVLDLPTAQLTAQNVESSPRGRRSTTVRAPVAPRAPREETPRIAPTPREEPRVQREPEPEPVSERPSGGGTGTLRVQTRPWSNVFIDGRAAGTTPLMNLQLSAGKHTLTFVNDQFGIRKTVKIEIEAGQTLTQSLTLE